MDPDWIEQGVLDVIKLKYWSFIPRRGSGRREERADPPRPGPGRDRQGRATARRSAEEELTALFAETRPEAIEDMRQAADELRRELAGETVTFVVNRNINVSNICTVGLRLLRLRPGQALAGRLRARPRGAGAARARRRWSTAPPRSACSRASIPTGGSRTTSTGCGVVKEAAPQIHLHAYSPMEVSHMCDVSGLSPCAVFERLRDAGLGSTPGTAAEVLHDGVRERISPNKLPVARWVEVIEASHARRPALHRHGDVRSRGGALGAGRAHARGALAPGAHGRLHRVRAAVLHPVPHAARPHARDRGDLDRGEPQAHRGLPPRARAAPCRASRPAGSRWGWRRPPRRSAGA